MGKPQYINAQDIFNQYERLRRSGMPKDKVIDRLTPLTKPLSDVELVKLGRMAQDWEKQYGGQSPVGQPQASSKLAAIKQLKTIQPIRPETILHCPACGRPNARQSNRCSGCGHDLSASQGVSTRKFKRVTDDGIPNLSNTYLGETTSLVLKVRDARDPLIVRPDKDMTMGRVVEGSGSSPDIDLSAFDADELGVSRMHLMLKRVANTVVVTDLGSQNCTYINEERLFPHEQRVLRNGDQLRLGKLVMKVMFKD
jgi:FHA domain-containing protein